MNWEAIGAIGELVGALGVILSLVYLALQIRRNSRMLDRWLAHPRFRRFFESGGVENVCTGAFSAYVKVRADELTRLQP